MSARCDQVEALQGLRVTDVACGSRDAQTICCTDAGDVYAWGDGDFGKLGLGGSDHKDTPTIVKDLCGTKIVRVFCGAQFSAVLSAAGEVWTW